MKALKFILWSLITSSSAKDDKKDDKNCANSQPAPFIYITVHDEIKNILKYSRDGCLLSKNVLNGGEFRLDSELRSMALGSYHGEEALYVADASTHRSQILVYLVCDDKKSWCFKKHVVTSDDNPGADHAYGITFDDRGNVYASFQHTDTVLRFEKDNFSPLDLNPVYLTNRNAVTYFDGTFLQFGEPTEHDKVHRGVRSILNVNGNIWIAHEDLEGIVVVSVTSGKVVTIITVNSPIGLYRPPKSDTVYCGCKSKQFGGVVYAIDAYSYIIDSRLSYRSKHMEHPTGITSYKDILYVAEQSQNDVHMFDIHSGEHLGKFVKDLPGSVEQLLLADI